MESLLPLLEQYGYPILALIVFLEAIGLPVPAAPAILAVGAAAAKGRMDLLGSFVLALSAMMTADITLFLLGRKTGWWLLNLLCRVSANPEACIYSSATYFHKRGRTALLFAKFIPGVNTMAPPMAGSMNMPVRLFLRYDLGGALLYLGTYFAIGFVCHTAIAWIIDWLSTLGRLATFLIASGVAFYLGRRIWRARRRRDTNVEKVSVADLNTRLGEMITIADVRSHGYYDQNAERIPGSIRVEPNRLPEMLPSIPPDRDIYLYCNCQNEATSLRVAELLQEAGYKPRVVVGGLNAWKKAGHPLERVPADEVIHLPKFD